ncbi:hypothetical protein ACHAPJ_012839 [Fusarium lateritium]
MEPSSRFSVPLKFPPIRRLETPVQWVDWFFAIRSIAQGLEIWDRMDPRQPDQVGDVLQMPRTVSYSKLKARLIDEAQKENKDSPSDESIILMHNSYCREAEIKLVSYQERAQKEWAVRNLIMTTVHTDLFENAMAKLPKEQTTHTLRQLLSAIQSVVSSSTSDMQNEIGIAYTKVVKEAEQDIVEPLTWYFKWEKIFIRAQ